MVLVRDGAPQDEEDIVGLLIAEEGGDSGDDDLVGSGEDGEADAVDVLLDGGGDDHLRRLAKAGVDDLHSGVAEGAGDDFRATVVAVEAGFCDKDADWSRISHRGASISFE